jgi:hypothetical protein
MANRKSVTTPLKKGLFLFCIKGVIKMSDFSYNPPSGWEDETIFPDYPTAPEVRPLFQRLFDQIRDAFNLTKNDYETHKAEMAKYENITANGQYAGEVSTEAVAADGALYDLLYLSSTGYDKAQANADIALPCLAMRVETGIGSRKLLKSGYVRNDAWNWTKGQLLYVSPSTAGLITATKPSTTGQRVQIVGYAVSADIIYFNPDYTWIEI